MATSIGVAIVEHNDHFLVGVRDAGTSLAGYHEFPGGKRLEPESTAETAVRECEEETGLMVKASRQLHQQSFAYAHDEVEIDFWLCQLEFDSTKFPDVKMPWHWVPRCMLSKLRFPAANADVLLMLEQNS